MSEYGLTVYFLWPTSRINYFLASGSLVLRYCDHGYNCPVWSQVASVCVLCRCSREAQMHAGPPPPCPPARLPPPHRFGGPPHAHVSKVVCVSLGFSISLSRCLVIFRRSFCRSLACQYFSLNLSAASGVRTHLSPFQYACDLGLPIGRMGARSPAP